MSGVRSGVRSKERSALEVSARFINSFAIWSAGEIVRALMSDNTMMGKSEGWRGMEGREGKGREVGGERDIYFVEGDDCRVNVAENHTHESVRST